MYATKHAVRMHEAPAGLAYLELGSVGTAKREGVDFMLELSHNQRSPPPAQHLNFIAHKQSQTIVSSTVFVNAIC